MTDVTGVLAWLLLGGFGLIVVLSLRAASLIFRLRRSRGGDA